jgi:nicotinamide mononucleotide transporter
MDKFLQTIVDSLTIMTMYEVIAMILSLAYIILAIRQSLWAWPAAFISTAIYIYLFYEYYLFMDSALNAYYLVMAVYGWYSWKYGGVKEDVELKVTSYGIMNNITIIAGLTLISFVLGYVMANYTKADFAYVDSFTTVFAVFATYLLTQKVIENWIYWVVIDAVSIYVYLQKGLNVTAVLFVIYTILAVFAFFKWKKEYETKTA